MSRTLPRKAWRNLASVPAERWHVLAGLLLLTDPIDDRAANSVRERRYVLLPSSLLSGASFDRNLLFVVEFEPFGHAVAHEVVDPRREFFVAREVLDGTGSWRCSDEASDVSRRAVEIAASTPAGAPGRRSFIRPRPSGTRVRAAQPGSRCQTDLPARLSARFSYARDLPARVCEQPSRGARHQTDLPPSPPAAPFFIRPPTCPAPCASSPAGLAALRRRACRPA